MYHSLKVQEEQFSLYIICFDDLAYEILKKYDLPDIVPIPLGEFESDELLSIKNTRTRGEYCWTCTPHVIRYVLDKFNLSEVTYLDADLFFYDKASILLDEFHNSNASVLITPHRYTPRYDQSKTSGIYCVQFMTFKSDEYSLTVLQWWQDRCIEWCFNRIEDGKFGDQKYLDDWPQRFRGVHVLHHIGGGVAPWNIQQFDLVNKSNKLFVNDTPIIFYHYHDCRQYSYNVYDLGGYRLTPYIIDSIYKPYINSLRKVEIEVNNISPGFIDPSIGRGNASWRKLFYNIYRRFRGTFNEYRFL